MKNCFLAMKKAALAFLLGFIFNVNLQAFTTTIFAPNVRVEDPVSITSHQYDPSIAVDTDENVYVVWGDERNDDGDIYFAKSTDGGATFGPHICVNDNSAGSTQLNPSIAVDTNGYIYVAWHDNRILGGPYTDIYFAKSTDGGASFGPDVRVSDPESFPNYSGEGHPSVAVGTDGYIYIAWFDFLGSNNKVHFAKSTDGGSSFGTDVRVDDDLDSSVSEQTKPSIAVDTNGNIYVAWHDERDGLVDIYCAKSTDGISFGADVPVNDVGTGSSTGKPKEILSIAVDIDGKIYVAWDSDWNGSYDIYCAKSTDNGASFGTDVLVNDASYTDQESPSIAVDPHGNIYVTWEDERSSLWPDIYFTKSTDSGANFETNMRVDNDLLENYQLGPSIAVDPNQNVYLTWQDGRNSSLDIYFAKGRWTVDFRDYAIFALHWLDEGCGDPDWCGKADLDKSTDVGWPDLKIFTDHWLE